MATLKIEDVTCPYCKKRVKAVRPDFRGLNLGGLWCMECRKAIESAPLFPPALVILFILVFLLGVLIKF